VESCAGVVKEGGGPMNTAYHQAQELLDRIETLSRLSPCTETDAQTAYTLSILMDIINEHTMRLREVVDQMGGAE
jgi:hypothetical protein